MAPASQATESLDALSAEVDRIVSLARSGELGSPIAHLGRWKVRDVVAHLGGVHRWATRIVTERSMAGPGFRKSKLDGAELCDWFQDGAAELLDTLRSLPADEPCPNFNPGSQNTVGWWIRRQLHETTIHRWDIEAGLGEVSPIEPKRAVDGIDEFLDVFVRTRGKHTLDATLELATTRPKQMWTLVPAAKPGRSDVTAGASDAEAQIGGRPAELLLALWGRKTIGEADLSVSGTADWTSLFRT